MKSTTKPPYSDELAQRKEDHIVLAQKARTEVLSVNSQFNYEPLFFAHPTVEMKWQQKFLGFDFDYPLWVSSMTGGTDHAKVINQNLAQLCGEFKLGMGLGSCRPLLKDDSRIEEFKLRKYLGSQPLFANIGVAQIEEFLEVGKANLLHEMVKKIEADGLIIHINPLQEWFQPEGDRYKVSPLQTIQKFLEDVTYPVLVKEVGQGFGPKSLKALLELPIAGIEFGAFGGTNFTLLESLRTHKDATKEPFIYVGHTASEMVEILNALPTRDKQFVISGGIKNMLLGYELKTKLKANSVIGMASGFLEHAMGDYNSLREYFLNARETLLTCKGILDVREEE